MAATSKFRLALIQLAVTSDKAGNVARAVEKVAEAAAQGAQIVSLPECFNSPYGTLHFPEYAEEVPEGPTCQALKKAAAENKVYLVGGSLPERAASSGKLYNTCTVWSPEGELMGKFRKMHLFDIDIPGKITFKESDALSSGNDFLAFKTPFCNVGVGICYDIRFAELAQIYSQQKSCRLLLYPGAFNMTTGPAHWELLAKARALDNQVYVATVSPARDESAGYVAWGHSTVVSPYGDVLAKAGHEEEIVYADIDLDNLEAVRKQIPVTVQRRTDIYSVVNQCQ